MANSTPKGLIIGIIVLAAVGTGLFELNKIHASSSATEMALTTPPPATSIVAKTADATANKVKVADSTDTKPADATASPEQANTLAGSVAASSSDAKTDTKTDTKNDTAATPAPASDKKPDTSSSPSSTPAATKSSTGDDKSGSLLSGPSALDIDVDKAMQDRWLGKDDAPVTIIEYASLTCPHCAHFSNDLLPEIKKQLIDTGKVRLIYRDYPLDTFAMKAAMMARCADPDRYFDLVEVIFKNQDRWVHKDDPMKGLIQLGSLAGMSEDYINACIKSEELQSALLAHVQDGQKNYKINATPTFVFNNGSEIMSGDKQVIDFVNTVNHLMGK